MTLPIILSQKLRDLEHGVRLCRADSVTNRTLVAFVATGGSLRIGFAYRYGSTINVLYKTSDSVLKTSHPPVGTFVLHFSKEITSKKANELTSEDLNLPWLTPEAMGVITSELGAHVGGAWQGVLDEVVDACFDLSLEQLKKLSKFLHTPSALPLLREEIKALSTL